MALQAGLGVFTAAVVVVEAEQSPGLTAEQAA
jgi:hypothetical protein